MSTFRLHAAGTRQACCCWHRAQTATKPCAAGQILGWTWSVLCVGIAVAGGLGRLEEGLRRSGRRRKHVLLELAHHVAGGGVAAGVHLAAGAPATPQGAAAAPHHLREVARGLTEAAVAIAVLGLLRVRGGGGGWRGGRGQRRPRQAGVSSMTSMLADHRTGLASTSPYQPQHSG